jgi:DnaJ-class molecular chaperone
LIKCELCGGKGFVWQTKGSLSWAVKCDRCQGKGEHHPRFVTPEDRVKATVLNTLYKTK